jgi:cell division protein FtsL
LLVLINKSYGQQNRQMTNDQLEFISKFFASNVLKAQNELSENSTPEPQTTTLPSRVIPFSELDCLRNITESFMIFKNDLEKNFTQINKKLEFLMSKNEDSHHGKIIIGICIVLTAIFIIAIFVIIMFMKLNHLKRELMKMTDKFAADVTRNQQRQSSDNENYSNLPIYDTLINHTPINHSPANSSHPTTPISRNKLDSLAVDDYVEMKPSNCAPKIPLKPKIYENHVAEHVLVNNYTDMCHLRKLNL